MSPVKDKIFYNNNVFSEYIGSNIFRICGFNIQNTILGEYKINVLMIKEKSFIKILLK